MSSENVQSTYIQYYKSKHKNKSSVSQYSLEFKKINDKNKTIDKYLAIIIKIKNLCWE